MLPPARAGFSLLEAIVVAAIVGILLVLGLPTYVNYASNQRTLVTARTLTSDLRTARQEAVTRRAPVSVTFAEADGACTRTAVASYVIRHGTSVIKQVCLPPDVVWSPLPAGPVVFQSTGTPQAGAVLTVRSARTGRQHTVTVAAESGVITDDTR